MSAWMFRKKKFTRKEFIGESVDVVYLEKMRQVSNDTLGQSPWVTHFMLSC